VGACTSIVLFPAAPSAAETAYYIYTYSCSGPLAPGNPAQAVKVQVSIPKTVKVGERLPLEWTLSDSKLKSLEYSKAGGTVLVTATARVGGLWQGWLDSLGTKDQPELAAGDSLALPTALTGAVATSKEGEITITPADLVINFAPPADKTTYNDTKTAPGGPIAYRDGSPTLPGAWRISGPDERQGFGDIEGDVHETTTSGDRAIVTFTGTGLQYITERHALMGPVDVTVDTDPARHTVVNAFKEADDETLVPPNVRRSQQVLWEALNLHYGKHTVTFTNLGSKYMLVDAFNVITDTNLISPEVFQTRCHPKDGERTTTATIQVVAASSDGNGSNDGNNNGNNNGNGHITDGDDSVRGIVVVSGGGQGHGAPTATATPTKKPKPSATPQVRVTPKGGAHTGEAPERGTAAPLLIGYGTVLALGGAWGGLLLRRRRTRAPRMIADRGNVG
jgi:hypothetical protein